MIGRMYTVFFSGVSVSVVQDFFELKPGTTRGLILHAVYITQSSSTTSAQLKSTIIRRASGYTSGSGGTAPTPASIAGTDAAATFTAEVNNTTRSSLGSGVTIHEECWNVLNGWVYIPTPEMRPMCGISEALIVGLETAPGAALTVSGVAYVEEIP